MDKKLWQINPEFITVMIERLRMKRMAHDLEYDFAIFNILLDLFGMSASEDHDLAREIWDDFEAEFDVQAWYKATPWRTPVEEYRRTD